MSTSTANAQDRSTNTLLLGALILAGLVMMREGPYIDNILQGWRFFVMAFFTGAIAGFVGWTQTFGIVPSFSLSGQNRQAWVAALTCALAFAGAGSYLNRTFSTPTDRTISVQVDAVNDSKDRARITVKMPDGEYRRYIFDKDAATTVKPQTTAQLAIARGALGIEFVAGIKPR
jgi:hypothetical protein